MLAHYNFQFTVLPTPPKHGQLSVALPTVQLYSQRNLSLIGLRRPGNLQSIFNFPIFKRFGILGFGHWNLFRNSKLKIRNWNDGGETCGY